MRMVGQMWLPVRCEKPQSNRLRHADGSKMKLLIANNHLENLAGSELHTLDLCRGFRRAGHQVAVFTLKPGMMADTLREEGFQVSSLPDLRSLSAEEFDLIYLHHATCEVVLGLIFAGKIPIVRGYLGIVPPLEKPINGDFLSGKTYGSELVERTYSGLDDGVPALIARNIYDDQQPSLDGALGEPPHGKPNFAVVSNHLVPALSDLLETAAKEGLCRFTHFGLPCNSVPVTAELLAPFDAVVTIGRTVPLTAALGKPVYVCDVHGADGWLTRENFDECQTNTFSGRTLSVQDWGVVREQLLDTSCWPGLDDLAWLRERVRRDHSLSRRVKQLETFFARLIKEAPSPVPPPGGYEAVLQFIEEREDALSGLRNEHLRLLDAIEETTTSARAQTRLLDLKIQEHEARIKEREARNQHLESRTQDLNRQLNDIKNSRTWRVLTRITHLKAKTFGFRRRVE